MKFTLKTINQEKNKIILLTAILLILIFHSFWLKKMGRYLVVEKTSPTADLIVVLGGGTGSRVDKGVDLYHQKIGRRLLMTGEGHYFNQAYPDIMANYAKEKGVLDKDIYKAKSTSTTVDAQKTIQLLQRNNWKSVAVVTSRYHTRRSYATFKKAFKNHPYKLYIYGANDGINYDCWWQDYEMSERVLIEWAKTAIYWFKI